MNFSLEDVAVRYGGRPVLTVERLTIGGPALVAVTGPNGAGKSTLLGALAGLRAHTGTVRYGDRPLGAWRRRDFARQVAVVPQAVRLDFPFRAEEVVLMGRTPYAAGLFESPADRAAVDRALAITDSTPFRGRDFRSLSGGERQRVVLASALAQSPAALLLDEPTTYLDLEHQVSIYKLLRDLAAQGLLVIAATHDLNLAMTYASRVIVLDRGQVAADGAPEQVLDAKLLARVFRVQAHFSHAGSGRPWIRYAD